MYFIVNLFNIKRTAYFKWNIFEQLELVKSIGFRENEENKEGTYDRWENLDVYFTVFHDYFKFLKFGFGRATDHASIEIRYGRITRDEGLELVKQNEGKIPKKYLQKFLEFANLSMDEFLEICDKFTNKEIFKVDEFGKIIRAGYNLCAGRNCFLRAKNFYLSLCLYFSYPNIFF